MPVGRRRKSGVKRHPNGQPNYYERVDPTPETQARRLAVFGDPKARGELNCPVDLLKKALTEEQYWAGRAARSTYARYQAAIMAPRTVAGQLQDYIQGGGGEPMDADAAQEAVSNYAEMITAVRRYSFRALKEVERVMRGAMPRDVDILKLGLEAICDHLDLRRKKAA